MSRTKLYHGPRDASFEVVLTDTGGSTCALSEAHARLDAAYWEREGRPYKVLMHLACVYPGCDGGIPGSRGRPGRVTLPRKRGRMFADSVECPQCAVLGVPDAVIVAGGGL